MLGTDFLRIGLLQDDCEAHTASRNLVMMIIEKLINLSKLPPRNSYFIFLPHKYEKINGGLGRAMAIV